jgi:hypothetical protein
MINMGMGENENENGLGERREQVKKINSNWTQL